MEDPKPCWTVVPCHDAKCSHSTLIDFPLRHVRICENSRCHECKQRGKVMRADIGLVVLRDDKTNEPCAWFCLLCGPERECCRCGNVIYPTIQFSVAGYRFCYKCKGPPQKAYRESQHQPYYAQVQWGDGPGGYYAQVQWGDGPGGSI